MDNLAPQRDSVRRTLHFRIYRFKESPAGDGHDRAKCLLHVLGHPNLVFAPFPVESQHWDTPLVSRIGINLAVAVGIGNHLAAAGKTDYSTVFAAAGLLESKAVALVAFASAIEHPNSRHVAAAAEFDVIATQKIVLAVELPPGDVHVHAAHAVMIVRRHLFKLRKV